MKKLINTVFASILFSSLAIAQADPKHTNYYFNPAPIESNVASVTFDNVVAKGDYAKMSAKITNKTNDFLLFKVEEVSFVFPFGTYKPKPGGDLFAKTKGGFVVIPPKKSYSRTINVNGDTRFHCDKFSVDFGGLYRLPTKGQVYEAKPFALPVATNTFEVGPYKCNVVGKVKQETQETIANFECKYSPEGNRFGIVNTNKISVIPDKNNQEYATINNTDDSAELIGPEETIKIKAHFKIEGRIVDMQFANMKIQWKEVFTDGVYTPAGSIGNAEFAIDPGMTAGKNK
jgi:hypothetical protein